MECEIQILNIRYFGSHVNQIYHQAWLLEGQPGVEFRAGALESYWLFSLSCNKFLNRSKPKLSHLLMGETKVVLEYMRNGL